VEGKVYSFRTGIIQHNGGSEKLSIQIPLLLKHFIEIPLACLNCAGLIKANKRPST